MVRPKSMIFALITIILILLHGLGWSHGCMDQEREALLSLKPFFKYLQWPMKAKEASSNCCEWKMVEYCNASTGRITKLSLVEGVGYDDQLWYLNASYFLPFEQLTSLDLSSNRLAGFVENQGFETLWLRLTKLEELYLGNNHFNDSIISSLCGLSSLRSLDLSGNEMGTNLNINGFESLWRLSNLELLQASGNHFNNTFLSSLRGLSSLKDLDLVGNQLSGTIDMEGDLEFLDLGWNDFNNSVFGSLNRLSHLKSLNLSHNQLTGSVHLQELAGLRNLEDLQLNQNSIEEIVGPEDKTTLNNLKVLGLAYPPSNGKGLMLKSLGALSTLKTIDLRGNVLNETNPFQDLFNLNTLEELFLDESSLHKDFLQIHVGSLTSLKVLHLSYCGLKGSLPNRGWCDLKNLEELDLGSNELEGELSPCMTNLSSLHTLRLAHNQFTGNIASTPIPNLQSIEILSLKNNHFELSLKAFANHSGLKFFFANGNQLIDESASQPWIPKFQLEVLSLSNASSLNFLYHQFNLRYLDISGSKFGGTFPNWLFENNTRLERIHLVDHSFVGPFQLPSHPLLNLSLIDISHNKLGGHVPSNISSIFPNLLLLKISHNCFVGTIPPGLDELKSLQMLDFSNNQLTGEIKVQFANTPLTFIKLSNNNLSVFIPPNVSDPVPLEFLSLDGNKFVGEIPDLSSLKYLRTLDISRNSLSGKLPSSIANMSELEEIVMFDNQFEGSIPLEFCKLHQLSFLDLAGNDLSGSIPPCFSELTFLQHLHLRGNKLRGPIPSVFRSCTSLIILDLGGNNFSGMIPNWIGNFSFLVVLLLEANNFHGNIPMELCQLRQLNILSISSNDLSGSLPACLSNFSSIAPQRVSYPEKIGIAFALPNYNLEDFNSDYANHDFSIQEDVELTTKSISLNYKGYILDHMYEIDLSHNRFSGEIPIEFGNLSNVRSLNLSHNNMTGLIPVTFSNLKQLESLDLSDNQLNGRIPPQLIEVTSLAVFIVAHNNLSGPVPMENQFETFNESSYEGNPLLCGPLLKKKCDETNVAPPATYPFIEQSQDDSFMEMADFWVSFAAAYTVILLGMATVLYINAYWRQVWFYYIGVCINRCYYFVVDKLY